MTISIDQPPVNDPIVDKDGKLTGVWRNWFTTNIGTLITYITQNGLQFPPITSDQRDALVSPNNGITIYNTTINAPQVYVGSWKTFTIS